MNDDYKDVPMASRKASPLGKLIDEFKSYTDTDTGRAYRVYCAENDMEPSQDLRNYMCWRVHGKTFDEMVADVERDKTNRRREAFAMPASIQGDKRPTNLSVAERRAA